MDGLPAWPARGLLGEEEKQAVIELFDEAAASGEAIGYNGAAEQAYCEEFAAFLGGGFADGVSSGTAAIYVALQALEIEPFTEVVVGPITDPGGMMPVPLLNCIPVVPDAAPGSYNTGPEQVEAVITPLTSAIIIAHIGGEPADIEGILSVAKRHGIPVIEDCAQSHGAEMNGRPVGSFGVIGVYSTMSGKHHCSGPQGGMVFTQKEELYWRIRQASDRGKPFGLPSGSTNCRAAMNLNSNDLAAAIGRVQLRKLPGIVRRRRDLAAALGAGLRDVAGVSVPEPLPGASPSYWWLRLRFEADRVNVDKATYCAALQAEGILLDLEYRNLPHLRPWFTQRRVFGTSGYPWTAPAYKGNADRPFPCPNALAAVDDHFNLTLRESWGPAEVDRVLAAFHKVDAQFRQ